MGESFPYILEVDEKKDEICDNKKFEGSRS